uniref:Uncharacterized protein n=1 Tax=Anguilla anguilla TaxID=7936 RepID=A0A0E9T326_ANGAN
MGNINGEQKTEKSISDTMSST